MIQKIYVKASDGVKRGLNKSLQESGARHDEVTVYREYKYMVPCLRDVNQGAAALSKLSTLQQVSEETVTITC